MSAFKKSIENLMKETELGEDFCNSLLNNFIRDAEDLTYSIKNSLENNKIREAGQLLHQLKGSSGSARADDIYNNTINAEVALINGDINQTLIYIKIISQLISDFYN